MDTVTAGALGLFAGGSVNGHATVWYSTDGEQWQEPDRRPERHQPDSGRCGQRHPVHAERRVRRRLVYIGNRLVRGVAGTPRTASTGRPSATASASPLRAAATTSSRQFSTSGRRRRSVPGGPGPDGPAGGRRGADREPSWQPASWISPNGSPGARPRRASRSTRAPREPGRASRTRRPGPWDPAGRRRQPWPPAPLAVARRTCLERGSASACGRFGPGLAPRTGRTGPGHDRPRRQHPGPTVCPGPEGWQLAAAEREWHLRQALVDRRADQPR